MQLRDMNIYQQTRIQKAVFADSLRSVIHLDDVIIVVNSEESSGDMTTGACKCSILLCAWYGCHVSSTSFHPFNNLHARTSVPHYRVAERDLGTLAVPLKVAGVYNVYTISFMTKIWGSQSDSRASHEVLVAERAPHSREFSWPGFVSKVCAHPTSQAFPL